MISAEVLKAYYNGRLPEHNTPDDVITNQVRSGIKTALTNEGWEVYLFELLGATPAFVMGKRVNPVRVQELAMAVMIDEFGLDPKVSTPEKRLQLASEEIREVSTFPSTTPGLKFKRIILRAGNISFSPVNVQWYTRFQSPNGSPVKAK